MFGIGKESSSACSLLRSLRLHDPVFLVWSQQTAGGIVKTAASALDPAELLFKAVDADEADRVGEVIEQHPELRTRLDPLSGRAFGSTALLCAVQNNNRKMIDVLVREGANIDARSRWWAGGFGVLDTADLALVPFLLERGATLDVHAAARLGMLEELRRMVAAKPGAVHARGGDHQTPLHFAADVPTARYLVESGSEIDARDFDHESTPAQYMVRDRPSVARFLVSCGCATDILMAAALGDADLVRWHLERDSNSIRTSVSEEYFPKKDPRSRGTIYIWTLGWHKTAHMVARDFGHDEILRLLMERSSPELRLTMACELGDESAMKSLLASRPSLIQDLRDEDKRRLAYAAQNNNTAAVTLLLRAGWPVDVRGQHGATPLHWAAWHGNSDAVHEMLRYGPDLEAVSGDYNLSPLGWAFHGSLNGWHRETGDYGATVKALLRAGAKPLREVSEVKASAVALEALREAGS